MNSELWVCPYCGRPFPQRYEPKKHQYGKVYGTKQLMALWAYNNWQRHLKAEAKNLGLKYPNLDSVPVQQVIKG